MSLQQAEGWTRRRFLGGLTVAGAAGLLGLYPRPIAAEPPPETTTLRTARTDSLCQAPKYVAAALLQGEGFTDVQHKHYPEGGAPPSNLLRMQELASGELDIDSMFAPMVITRLEAGDPIVVLAGVHIGCMELYRIERVRAIRDLRGKTVAVPKLGGVHYLFLASMLAYTGLAPRTDLHWMTPARAEAVWLLAEGKIDALLTPRHGRRNSGPSRSGTSWSTRVWIGPGPSTSAA